MTAEQAAFSKLKTEHRQKITISCGRWLKPICKRLGIAPGGMHAFRRGRVSHLQASNVPSDFTKNQVGHSSLRTTSGYTHFTEQFIRDTVERLGGNCAQVV